MNHEDVVDLFVSAAAGAVIESNEFTGGVLFRFNADGTEREELLDGISAAASLEFGAGRLVCTDLYVATSGRLVRYAADVPGATVPWH